MKTGSVHETGEREYLSEEALEALINNVENEHMLSAPSYLKPEILDRVSMQEYGKKACIEAERTGEMPRSGSSGKGRATKDRALGTSGKRALRLYSVRVGTAVAAAIFLLFLLPGNVEKGQVSEPNRNVFGSVVTRMNEKTNEFCSALNAATNQVVTGGINNEE